MNKSITFRTAISVVLIFLFSLPIHAQEYSAIEGLALDENGELMAGAIVEVFSDGVKRATTTTGHDGTYVVKPLQNGTYELRAYYPTYENVEIKDVWVTCSGPTKLDMNFAPKTLSEFTVCGRVKPLILPEPASSVSVTGRLKDAFNRPAVGVTVELYRDDTLYWCGATTGEKGCYNIYNVEPGTYTVVTEFNGVKTMERNIEIMDVEYVEEKIVDFYFNRKIFNHYGEFVANIPPSMVSLNRGQIEPQRR